MRSKSVLIEANLSSPQGPIDHCDRILRAGSSRSVLTLSAISLLAMIDALLASDGGDDPVWRGAAIPKSPHRGPRVHR
jgi:hypothetical protein